MSLSRYFINIEDRSPIEYVTVYPQGAVVNAAQTDVNTVTVHDPHGLTTGDLFLYAITRLNVSVKRVFEVSSFTASTVTFSGDTFSFPDNSLLVHLGSDTVTARSDGSWPLPNWDGSAVGVYSDPGGVTALDNSSVRADPGNEAGFWAAGETYWLVGRSALGRPARVYLDVGPSNGGSRTGPILPSSGVNGEFFWYRSGAASVSILYVWGPDSSNVEDWNEVMRTG
jgi:hypothetical protein